jgi:predicted dehydrogenase
MNTMQLGIYAEMLQRWLGPFERVIADAATFVRSRRDTETQRQVDIDVPDSIGVLASAAGGVRVTLRVSNVIGHSRDANGVSLYGSLGTLHWSTDDALTLAPVGEGPQELPPDAGTDGAWNVERDFVASIRDGRPVELTSFADGLRYMQFTEAVWRSWHEGCAVDVALV